MLPINPNETISFCVSDCPMKSLIPIAVCLSASMLMWTGGCASNRSSQTVLRPNLARPDFRVAHNPLSQTGQRQLQIASASTADSATAERTSQPVVRKTADVKTKLATVQTVAFQQDDSKRVSNQELQLDSARRESKSKLTPTADDKTKSRPTKLPEQTNQTRKNEQAKQSRPTDGEPKSTAPAFGSNNFQSTNDLGLLSSAGTNSISLAEIEQIALANNPAIAAANYNSQVANGLRQQVGTLPNPTVGYSGMQLADQQTDQHTLFVEQEFVRGNKLALNRAVLAHTAQAQQWETETQRYRVLTDVRTRFYEALAAQQRLTATQEFVSVAKRGVDFAEQRKEAGEGTTIEVLQSQTLLSEINLALEQTTAVYQGAWNDLAAIAGMQAMAPTLLMADFSSTVAAPDWDNAFNQIVSQSPELAAAEAIVSEKRANLQRQQVQATPNLTGQIGAGYDRGTDSGLINVLISAPIPTKNKNCGNIAAAHAELHRAAENVRRIEQGIKSRLARAAQEYQSAEAAVSKYQQEIVPQAEQTLKLSEEGYREGELDFLQVLVVRRVFYDATIRLIVARGELAQANARIEGLLLSGGLDAPIDYTAGDSLRGQTFGGQ